MTVIWIISLSWWFVLNAFIGSDNYRINIFHLHVNLPVQLALHFLAVFIWQRKKRKNTTWVFLHACMKCAVIFIRLSYTSQKEMWFEFVILRLVQKILFTLRIVWYAKFVRSSSPTVSKIEPEKQWNIHFIISCFHHICFAIITSLIEDNYKFLIWK